MLQLKHYLLPHDAAIPGARGHKKQIVPRGTRIWCICYGTKLYWCAYLTESQALKCLDGLNATVSGRARRTIPLDTLVAWNFTNNIPKRICRPVTDNAQ